MKTHAAPRGAGLLNIAAQAVFLLAILLLLPRSGAPKAALIFGIVLCAFYLSVLLQLFAAFRTEAETTPYSYDTIYYIGFTLFFLSVLITHAVLTLRIAAAPESYDAREVLHLLQGSAKQYMQLSFPFVLLFSLALCISNISLIRHEGARLVNFLGIILSGLLLFGELFIYAFDYSVTGSVWKVMFHDLVSTLLAAIYLYFECMLIGAMAANGLSARYEPKPDREYMIILGCALRPDGTPTPLLRSRIDRALAFYRKQKAETGKELYFITSGGQGADEALSESAAMKRYLLEHGVAEERIIEENGSTDTFENMKFSKEKIAARRAGAKVAFATNDYHVFRSGLCARRVELSAVGVGAKTKWYFWPNASVREFIGLLTEDRKKQAAILGGLIVSYLVLTLLVYR